MDLIDRDKLAYEDVECVDGNTYMVVHEPEIRLAPAAFEEMTNGEVLKAVFPDCIDYFGIIEVKTHLDMGKTFRRSWWDSPYKGQDGLI